MSWTNNSTNLTEVKIMDGQEMVGNSNISQSLNATDEVNLYKVPTSVVVVLSLFYGLISLTAFIGNSLGQYIIFFFIKVKMKLFSLFLDVWRRFFKEFSSLLRIPFKHDMLPYAFESSRSVFGKNKCNIYVIKFEMLWYIFGISCTKSNGICT